MPNDLHNTINNTVALNANRRKRVLTILLSATTLSVWTVSGVLLAIYSPTRKLEVDEGIDDLFNITSVVDATTGAVTLLVEDRGRADGEALSNGEEQAAAEGVTEEQADAAAEQAGAEPADAVTGAESPTTVTSQSPTTLTPPINTVVPINIVVNDWLYALDPTNGNVPPINNDDVVNVVFNDNGGNFPSDNGFRINDDAIRATPDVGDPTSGNPDSGNPDAGNPDAGNPVSNPPVFGAGGAGGASGTAAALNDGTPVTANDIIYTAAATSTQTITYRLADGDSNLFNINGATGAVTFKTATTPDYDTNTDGYSFTVIASAGGEEALQAVTIAITPVDEFLPSITAGLTGAINVGGSDTAISGTVVLSADGDSFADHQTTTITPPENLIGTYGTIAFNGNDWVYTIDRTDADTIALGASEATTETFTVAVTGAGTSRSENIIITITGANDAPTVIVDTGSGSITEGAVAADIAAIRFRASDSDSNDQNYQASGFTIHSRTDGLGDTVINDLFEVYLVSGTGASSVFGVRLKSGQSLDYEQLASYQLSVSYQGDGGGLTSPQSNTITITVIDVTETPTFTSGTTGNAAVLNDGTQVTVSDTIYTAAAVSTQTITYRLADGDSNLFNINGATGAVTFKTATTPDYDTNIDGYSFTVIASAGGEEALQAVTIAITPVDEFLPSITAGLTGAINVGGSDTAISGTVVLSADGDSFADHQTTTITPPENLIGTYGTIAFNGNDWVYTIDRTDADTIALGASEATTETFTVAVTGAGTSRSENIIITITGANDAPTVIVDTGLGSIAEGAVAADIAAIRFRASDADSNDQNYQASGFTIHSRTDGLGDTIINDLFEVYLASGTGASSVFGVRLKSGQSLDYEQLAIYQLSVSYQGDGSGLTSPQSSTITITVIDVTETPTFTSGATGNAGVLNDGTQVTVSDAIYTAAATSTQTITYRLADGDSNLFNINSATGAVTFKAATTPDYDTNTDGYSFTVIASAGGEEASQAVTIAITPVDEFLPSITAGLTGAINVGGSDTAISGTVVLSADGDSLAAHQTTTITPPENLIGTYGTIAFNGNDWVYTIDRTDADTIALGASGVATDVFTVAVTGAGTSRSENIIITITGANDAPTVIVDTAAGSIAEGVVAADIAAIRFRASDSDSNDQNYQASGFTIHSRTDGLGDTVINDLFEVYLASGTGASSVFGVRLKSGQSLDYEQLASYQLSVSYQGDGGGVTSPQSSTITIAVTDVNDLLPMFSSGGVGIGLVDNTEVSDSTVLYTAVATDNAGAAVTYSLEGGDSGLFTIDTASGIVTFINSTTPDFETNTDGYAFMVRATAGDQSATQAVTIDIIDINDQPPVFSSGGVGTGLVDNIEVLDSTVLYTAVAAGNAGAAVTYSLEGGDSGLFTIDTASGLVTFINPTTPDFETNTDGYAFTVRATAGDQSATQAVNIDVIDVNDQPPVFSSGGVGIGLVENIEVSDNTVLYTAVAAGNAGAAVTYSLEGVDALLFTIDTASGIVTFTNPATPDFETNTDGYAFTVRATAGDQSATQAVTIDVTDVNDLPPVFSSGGVGIGLVENIEVSDNTVLYTAVAAGNAGAAVTYSLEGGDSGLFTIDTASGIVTFINPTTPDFETNTDGYAFTVRATAGDQSATQAVTIDVTDVNDQPPVFSSGGVGTGLVDNTEVSDSTVLYTAVAAGNAGAVVSYSLEGGDSGLFTIDTASGLVTFTNPATPDFETNTDGYAFTVRATAGDQSATQAVTIDVTDVNDQPPVFSSGGVGNALIENTEVSDSTVLYTAVAAGNAGAAVTYSLEGGDSGLFTIDTASGIVTFINPTTPDFETNTDGYAFTVRATAGDQSATQAVSIAVTDVNDQTLVFSSGAVGIGLVDNTEVSGSTVLYTAVAAGNAGAVVSYSLEGGDSGLFTIDTASGEITFINPTTPDFETNTDGYAFTVRATAGDQSATQAVSIAVTDVNDQPPVFSSDGVGNTLIENTEVLDSTVLYTAVAAGNAGAVVSYSLEGVDSGLFTIDTVSGIVTFTNPTTPDFETNTDGYALTVRATAGDQSATQAVTIAITPVDEHAAIIGGDTTGTVTEDADVDTVSGTLTVTDADSPEHQTTAIDQVGTIDGTYGSITFTGNDWVYTLDNTRDATQAIAPGLDQSGRDSFTVTAGETTQDIEITITGTNDAPTVIVDTAAGSIAEGAIAADIAAIRFRASDSDSNDQNYQASGFTIHSRTDGFGDTAINDLFEVYLASGTGASSVFGVRLKSGQSLDYEQLASYELSVSYQEDGGGVTSPQSSTITITVIDIAEIPIFTSGTTGNAAVLNDGMQVTVSDTIYTAAAVSTQTITYRLADGDSNLFNINSATGAVTFKTATTPDYDTNTDGYNFTVIASAGGEEASQAVTIAITPVDEHAAIIGGDTTGTVTEDADVDTVSGTLTVTDADSPEHQTTAIDQVGTIDGTYGSITFTGNTWVYTLDNTRDATQVIGPFQSDRDTFTVTAGETTQDIEVAIIGTNDAPTLTVYNTAGSIGDSDDSTVDAISFSASDVDANHNIIAPQTFVIHSQTVGVSDAEINDLFEVYRVTPTGSTADTVIYGIRLKFGQTLDYEQRASYDLTLTARELGRELSSPHSDIITITVIDISEIDVNSQPPVFSSGSIGNALIENTEVSDSTVLYTAVAAGNAGAAVTYSLEGGDSGLFTIDTAFGLVTFINPTTPDYETNADGYSFTVIASVGNEEASQSVTIVITPVDEFLPSITAGLSGAIDVGGSDTAISGTVVLSADGDSFADHQTTTITPPENLIGTYGTIAFNGNDWVYTIDRTDADTIALGASEATTETFTVAVTGAGTSRSENIIITITGANDAPTVIVDTGLGSIAEGAVAADIAAIRFRASDADSNDQNYQASGFTIHSRTDGLGDTIINDLFEVYLASGTGASSVFGVRLKAGQSLDYEQLASYQLSVSYQEDGGGVTSPQSSTITITVIEVTETPTFTSGATGNAAVLNDGTPVTVSDTIYTAAAVSTQTITYRLADGDSNLFNINSATGAVTFKTATTPDYDTNTDGYSFTVIASAGSEEASQAVTIAITPVDEHAAIIGGDTTGTVTEDADVDTVSGLLTVTDADSPEHQTTAIDQVGTIDGTYGSITFTGNTWVYTLDNTRDATQAIGPGLDQSGRDTFTVTAGETTQDIEITIIGTNDAPTLTVYNTAGSIAENDLGDSDDGTVDAVSFSASDVDANHKIITPETFVIHSQTVGVSDAEINDLFEVYRVTPTGSTADTVIYGIRLKFGQTLDYEQRASYGLTLTARELGRELSSPHSDIITITVIDISEILVFTEGATGNASALDDGTALTSSDVVYTAAAVFVQPIVYSLADGGDADLFNIDSATGAVTFKTATTPDYETNDDGYAFTVRATAGDQSATQAVTIAITPIDEDLPSISGDLTGAIDASVGRSVITTGVIILSPDTDTGPLSHQTTTITPPLDSGLHPFDDSFNHTFGIYGAIVFRADSPNQWHYSLLGNENLLEYYASPLAALDDGEIGTEVFTISVDGAVASRSANITITVTGEDDSAIVITDSNMGSIAESAITANIDGVSFRAYDPDASDQNYQASGFSIQSVSDIISSAALANLFEVYLVSGTGADAIFGLRAKDGISFDYEQTPEYMLRVSYEGASSTAITIAVIEEIPVFTEGAISASAALDDGTALTSSDVVYTAAAVFFQPIVYSLADGGDADLFNIDSATGAVTFKAATTPDYETNADGYSFTAIASGGGAEVEQAVTIAITPIDEDLPRISGDFIGAIDASVGTSITGIITLSPDTDTGPLSHQTTTITPPPDSGLTPFDDSFNHTFGIYGAIVFRADSPNQWHYSLLGSENLLEYYASPLAALDDGAIGRDVFTISVANVAGLRSRNIVISVTGEDDSAIVITDSNMGSIAEGAIAANVDGVSFRAYDPDTNDQNYQASDFSIQSVSDVISSEALTNLFEVYLVSGTGAGAIFGLRAKDGISFDYEQTPEYMLRVSYEGASSDIITIAVTDINEAPTALALSASILDFGSVDVGTVTTTDVDDARASTYTYRLTTTGDTENHADNGLFSIDAATGVLTYAGGYSARKAGGDSYHVEVTVEDVHSIDATVQSLTEHFEITASNDLYIQRSGEVRRYSHDPEGHTGLDEETTPTGAFSLGMVGFLDSPDATFTLAEGDDGDDFELVDGVLHHISLDPLGDREAADGGGKIINILVNADGTGDVLYKYVVTLVDVDENEAPTALTLSASVLEFGSVDVGTVTTTDEDDPSVSTYTYSLTTTGDAEDYADNSLFNIDAVTGVLTYTGGDISRKAGGEIYNVEVTVEDTHSIDANVQSLTEHFEITTNNILFLQENTVAGGAIRYSHAPISPDSFDEGTPMSDDLVFLFLGYIHVEGMPGATFALADTSQGGFTLLLGSEIYYNGNDALGDREAADGGAKILDLIVDIDGAGPIPAALYRYAITLADIDDNAPQFITGFSGDVTAVPGTAPTISDSIIVTDADATAAKRTTDITPPTNLDGAYGSFTFNGNDWTYVLGNTEAQSQAVQALIGGQQVFDTITVGVVDTLGVTHTQDLTITITGANDMPAALTLSAFSLSLGSVDVGTVIITDVDDASLSTYRYSLTTTGDAENYADNSLFNIDAVTGVLSYTGGDNARKAGGESYHVEVTVNDLDGDGATVYSLTENFEILASTEINEAPTALTLSASVLEFGSVDVGIVTTTDANQAGLSTYRYSLTTTGDAEDYADNSLFNIDAVTGVLTYTGGDIGRKAGGESYDVEVTVEDVHSGDAKVQSLTEHFEITASNILFLYDANVAGGAIRYSHAPISPDLFIEETLVNTDRYTIGRVNIEGMPNATVAIAHTSQGEYRILFIGSEYIQYTGNDVLGDREAADGGVKILDLIVDIDGSGPIPAALYRYAITLADIDDNAPEFIAGFSGDVTAVPGTTPTISDSIMVTDADATAAKQTTDITPPTNLDGAYGSFTFNGNDWTYVLGNTEAQSQAVQALADGQQAVDTITVGVVDTLGVTHTQDLTITITGANDRPAALTLSAFSLSLGSVDVGTVIITDVDDASLSTYRYSLTTTGDAENYADNSLFNIDAVTGVLTYTGGDNARKAGGESYHVEVTVDDLDGDGATVYSLTETFEIFASTEINEAPTALTLSASVLEFGSVDVGTVTTTDVDAPSVSTYTYSLTTTGDAEDYADNSLFNIDTMTGVLTYTGGDIGRKAGGEIYDVEVTVEDVHSGDAKVQSLTEHFEITASNILFLYDANVAGGAIRYSHDPISPDLFIEETLVNTDRYTIGRVNIEGMPNATVAIAHTSQGEYRILFIGSEYIQYTGNDVLGDREAADGGVKILDLIVDIDGGSGHIPAALYRYAITIADIDDNAPEFIAGFSGDVMAVPGTIPTISDSIMVTDADATAAKQTTDITPPTNLDGAYGSFTFNGNDWTYVLGNTEAQSQAVQALVGGQQAVDTITVGVVDTLGVTHTQDLTITITGANDRPDALALSAFSLSLGSVDVGTVIITDGDDASLSTYRYRLTTIGDAENYADNSLFNIDAVTGVLTYTGGDNARKAGGESYHVEVTVDDLDGDGATVHSLTEIFEIFASTEINEAPTALTLSASVLEFGSVDVGTVTTTDVDDPSVSTYTYSLTTTGDAEDYADNSLFNIDAMTGVLTYTGGDNARKAGGEIYHVEVTVEDVHSGDAKVQSLTEHFEITASNILFLYDATVAGGAIRYSHDPISPDLFIEETLVNTAPSFLGSLNVEGMPGATFALTDANREGFSIIRSDLFFNTSDTGNDAFGDREAADGGVKILDLIVDIDGAGPIPAVLYRYAITLADIDDNAPEFITGFSGDVTAVPGTAPTISDSIIVTDADATAAKRTTDITPPTNLDGAYGSFTFNGNDWTYVLGNTEVQSQTVQALIGGQQVFDTITVEVVDTHGVTHAQDVTITITGANDVPTALTLSASVLSLGGVDVGTVTTTDVDDANLSTYRYRLTTIGDVENSADNSLFSIDAMTGVLSYTGSDNARKAGGESYHVEVTVDDLDGDGTAVHSLTETFEILASTDTNEAPTALTLSASVLEFGSVDVGTVTTADVDDPSVSTYTYSLTTTGDAEDYADNRFFNIDAMTGVLTYTGGDNARKAGGESYNVEVTVEDVHSGDVNVQSLTEHFEITASNIIFLYDAAVARGAIRYSHDPISPDSFNEETLVNTFLGQIHVRGMPGATFALADTSQGEFTLLVNPLNGELNLYYNGNDVLGDREAADGGAKILDLIVDIDGAGPIPAALYRYAITIADIDDNVPQFIRGFSGDVTAVPGTTPTISDSIMVTDADATAAKRTTDVRPPINLDGAYGSFTFNGNDWTYALGNTEAKSQAVQALVGGQQVFHTISVAILDTRSVIHREDLTITITGANDMPTALTLSASILNFGIVDVGTVTTTDVDDASLSTYRYSLTTTGDAENHADNNFFNIDAVTGLLTYTGGDNARKAGGEIYHVEVTVNDVDGDGATVYSLTENFEILASTEINEAPTALTLSASVLSFGSIDVGTVIITDVNAASVSTYRYSLTTTGDAEDYADNSLFSIDAVTGVLTYTGDDSGRKSGGEIYHVEVTVDDLNDHGATVHTLTETFEIAARNNDLFIRQPDQVRRFSHDLEGHIGLDEETRPSTFSLGFLGFENFSDATFTLADGDDTQNFALDFFFLSFVTTDPNAAPLGDREAADGGVQIINFLVDLDGAGPGTAVLHKYAVTLADVDDNAPQFISGFNAEITAIIGSTVSDSIAVTDADATAAKRTTDVRPPINLDGAYGSFTFNGNDWTYVLGNTAVQSLAVQVLADGQQAVDTISIAILDTNTVVHRQDLTITITGINDRPTLAVSEFGAAGTVDEFTTGANIGRIRFSVDDIDANDAVMITASNVEIREAGAVSALFEAYLVSGTVVGGGDAVFGIKVIEGQILGEDMGGNTPEHTLSISYDDQSGADNAVSLAHEVTVDII